MQKQRKIARYPPPGGWAYALRWLDAVARLLQMQPQMEMIPVSHDDA